MHKSICDTWLFLKLRKTTKQTEHKTKNWTAGRKPAFSWLKYKLHHMFTLQKEQTKKKPQIYADLEICWAILWSRGWISQFHRNTSKYTGQATESL